jgi:hypothetical protein
MFRAIIECTFIGILRASKLITRSQMNDLFVIALRLSGNTASVIHISFDSLHKVVRILGLTSQP